MQPDEEISSSLFSGKAQGLIEFLGYVKSKGILAGRTADAYKSACSLVLSIDGDGWEKSDVRGLDVDLQMQRYIRLRGASAKPASLTTYRHRVQAAIDLYRTFLDNPAGFRGSSARRPSASRRRGDEPASSAPAPDGPPSPRTSSPEGSALVTYPFPLRSGAMAYLQLPRDLPSSDAKRLCAFLDSLAIDSSAETSPGATG
jgi:hypothetical protein